MKYEDPSMSSTAHRLGIAATDYRYLSQLEISDALAQQPPYLSLQEAAVYNQDGMPHDVLAKARFGLEICDGHYPGCPSIPLVDSGRVMDQTTALLAVSRSEVARGKIPLLRRVSRLRAESMETLRPDDFYWIWAATNNDRFVTRLYSGAERTLISTIEGWDYDFAERPSFGQRVEEVVEPHTEDTSWFNCEQTLDEESIMDRIPQRPPFLVLNEANVGRTLDGTLVGSRRWPLGEPNSIGSHALFASHGTDRDAAGDVRGPHRSGRCRSCEHQEHLVRHAEISHARERRHGRRPHQ
jgi:hypothetical protein